MKAALRKSRAPSYNYYIYVRLGIKVHLPSCSSQGSGNYKSAMVPPPRSVANDYWVCTFAVFFCMCDICYFPAQTWCKTESQQPHDHSIGKAPWKHWDIGIPVFLFRASDRCLSASLMVLGSSCWRIGCIFAYVFPLCVVFCRFRPLSRIHARISIVSSLKEPWERTDSGHSPKKLAFQKLKRRRCYKTGRFLWLMFHNVFFCVSMAD